MDPTTTAHSSSTARTAVDAPIYTTTNTTNHVDPNALHVSSAQSGAIPTLGASSNLQPTTATGAADGTTGANTYQTSGSSPSANTGIHSGSMNTHSESINTQSGSTGARYDSNNTHSGSANTHSGSSNTLSGSTNSQGTAQSTSSKESSTPTATGIRQRVNNLSTDADHKVKNASAQISQQVNNLSSQVTNLSSQPAVKNAKGAAQRQVGQLREVLGRSQTVVDLEKRFNVDRVVLVGGGILAYILLIPLNLFGLALPTTTLLTLLPPAFLALGVLEQPSSNNDANEAASRALLAYFVTLGFIQFLESAAAGLLERRIPQYYTVKLLALAYLLHPRTQGAINLHNNVYRPLLARAQAATPTYTPPQSTSAREGYNISSPTAHASATRATTHSPEAGSNNPFVHPSAQTISVEKQSIGFDSQGNITKNEAEAATFVVNEMH